MLTLDDGYLDNWVFVLPLLRRYGMRATVFVSSEFIDVHAVWPKVAHLRSKVRHVVDTFVELAEQGKLD